MQNSKKNTVKLQFWTRKSDWGKNDPVVLFHSGPVDSYSGRKVLISIENCIN